jgi:Di-haem cytochrome c peroxidase
VASSQGVFAAQFEQAESGRSRDEGAAFADDVFNVAGVNVRRVEPRNTPTTVNAVFNHSNFWDGRAHNLFNGVSIIGPLDRDARIWVARDGALVQEEVRIPNSSLASQAVGPPVNDFEMSFLGRTFPDIGRKLLSLRPLGLQLVHPRDSVLGKLSQARLVRGAVVGGPGLRTTYANLIMRAFRPEYWASNETIELEGGSYEQIEANFALFFGLAIQLYESTCRSACNVDPLSRGIWSGPLGPDRSGL